MRCISAACAGWPGASRTRSAPTENVGRTSENAGKSRAPGERLTRRVESGVDLHEDRQVIAARSDVADLGPEVLPELLLPRQVEVLCVRCLEVGPPSDEDQARRKIGGSAADRRERDCSASARPAAN